MVKKKRDDQKAYECVCLYVRCPRGNQTKKEGSQIPFERNQYPTRKAHKKRLLRHNDTAACECVCLCVFSLQTNKGRLKVEEGQIASVRCIYTSYGEKAKKDWQPKTRRQECSKPTCCTERRYREKSKDKSLDEVCVAWWSVQEEKSRQTVPKINEMTSAFMETVKKKEKRLKGNQTVI